jgi:CBS domain-containing protein
VPYRAFTPRVRGDFTLADVRLTDADMDRLVDLAPYMNTGALTVHPSTRLARVHLLFRSLGLRHLTVTDSANTVVGIITRRDITDAESRVPSPPPSPDLARGHSHQY